MTFHPQVFSCRLGSEQETALSIIDPVNIQVELCGSPTYQSSSGLLDAFNVEDIPPLLEVRGRSPPQSQEKTHVEVSLEETLRCLWGGERRASGSGSGSEPGPAG